MTTGKKTTDTSPGIPPRQMARIRLRRYLPLLVWLGVLTVVMVLFLRQQHGLQVTGYAEETRYELACETAGRLKELRVGLHDHVNRGQVLAAMDEEALRLELRGARAELERDKALWELESASLRVEQQTNLRRYARDVADTRIDWLDTLAELAEARITLQGLELTLDRTLGLQAGDVLSQATLEEDRTARDAQAEWVEGLQELAAQQLAAHEAAEIRYEEFLTHHVPEGAGSTLQSLAEAFEAQEARIEGLSLSIERLVLKAPVSGRVVEILHREGEVLAAGEPVLSILEPLSQELLAWLPEHRILDLATGDEVRLRRLADPKQVIEGRIASLGTGLEPVPARAVPMATLPSWGRAVLIPLPATVRALPGEAFEIDF